jgi:hypothetical protein
MTFWAGVFASLIANVFAGVLLVMFYVIIQWFLHATDVTVSYNWRQEGTKFHPSFDIRNRSMSKTYVLANIAYSKKNDVLPADNKSLWGKELKPGSITFLDDEVAPVKNTTSWSQCLEVEVEVRLQNGRRFWLKGQGPGQYARRIQRIAFWLRQKVETAAVPLE